MSGATLRRPRRMGFTIVELLITIGLIIVLASLLFPAMRYARSRARESACTAQLRQIGQAFQMYLADHDLHRPSYLHQLHPQYITDKRLFICPNDAWVDQGGWAWSAWGQLSTPRVEWPIAVSYGYFWFRRPTNTRHDWDWLRIKKASNVAGYAVCVLHGERCNHFIPGAAPLHQGLTLRLTFDGAVVRRQIHYEPGHPCFTSDRLRTE